MTTPRSACLVVTYLSWRKVAGGCLEVTVACDGGMAGDCGWHVELTDVEGITNADWQRLRSEHRVHSHVQSQLRA